MSEDRPASKRIVDWYRSHVRPLFERTQPGALEELDRLSIHIDALEKQKEQLFPICLLGQAGVGKSTLINTLVADTEIVVPSGGGTGPLTANALHVVYGDVPSFVVRYHSPKQLNETRFALEQEIARQSKSNEAPLPPDASEDGEGEGSQEPFESSVDSQTVDLDSDEQRKGRTESAIGRARLLVGGTQSADRELPYLVDALRWVLGQRSKFESELNVEDLARLKDVQEAIQLGPKAQSRRFDSTDDPNFGHRLREHACGFFAPLIREMVIHWPSPLLRNSLELVDLPGIGILSDVYESITADYLRNRAKAVMLVVDSRGIRRDDAQLLKTSGFLNRLLHSSGDLSTDPVALIVAVVKIDDVAVENWRNDRAVHGNAVKRKEEHFQVQVDQSKREIAKRLEAFLREVWEDDSEGKRLVIQSIIDKLQIFPVSAPQYRLLCSRDPDEDDRPFLQTVDATNIPALRASLSRVAQDCLAEQNQRRKDALRRFFGLLRATLEVLAAQRSEERRVELEVSQFKESLESFMAPIQREFDNRRGGFRAFLRKTIPAQIEAKVGVASSVARKAINGDLNKLRDAHWKTLQAAVRREGTFYGSRHINLPHDFALRYEEPVAEVWSRDILVAVRRETREFADYQAGAVTQVLEWAKGQGIRRSTRLLEALVESVKQHRQQVDAVGKEAVAELRDKVRAELIKKIEGPIRRKCQKFVAEQKDFGSGVKARILELFQQLADEVVESASAPATSLLVQRFAEVDAEILTAFRDHNEPLVEAADALVQRKEMTTQRQDDELGKAVDNAIATMPSPVELDAEIGADRVDGDMR